MSEIFENQKLEIEHLLSFRGKVTNDELEAIGRDMESAIQEAGARRNGYPVTATYGIEGNKMDVELLIPIDRSMSDTSKYHYKKQLKIVNAVVAKHIGNPTYLQQTCNELNQYIMDNGLTPITVGYSVPQQVNATEMDKSIVNMYVGISPNVV